MQAATIARSEAYALAGNRFGRAARGGADEAHQAREPVAAVFNTMPTWVATTRS